MIRAGQLATTIALIDDDVVMLRLMTVQFRKLGGVVSPFSSGSAFIRSGGVSELWDVIGDSWLPRVVVCWLRGDVGGRFWSWWMVMAVW